MEKIINFALSNPKKEKMVIQRWQTVMLLIAFGVMTCFTFCSLGQLQTEQYTFDFTTLGFTAEGIQTEAGMSISTWYFFCVSLMSALLPLLSIFLFRNPQLQRRMCLVEVLFLVATTAVGALLGYTAIPASSIGWSTVIICPLLALIADINAWRLIGADMKKLRSVDRFRD